MTTGNPPRCPGIYEVCKYLTIANYSTAQFSVQANLDWWNGLDADSQKAILEAGESPRNGSAARWRNRRRRRKNRPRCRTWESTLTAEERAQMVAATKSVWDAYVTRAGRRDKNSIDLAHKVFD